MVVSLQALTSLLCLLRFIFSSSASLVLFFFFNDTATTEIYTLSLHDALPISFVQHAGEHVDALERATTASDAGAIARAAHALDRKSTRLNSSHSQISYAVFCLKKKKKNSNKTPNIHT